MNRLYKTHIIFILLLFLISCKEKAEKQDKAKADSLAEAKREELVPADAPDWFVNEPNTKGYVFSRGMARSRRNNIARDKALLKAQSELAIKISTDSLSTGVTLENVQVLEQKQVQEGKYWRVYVLLRIPMDSLNVSRE